MSTARVAAVQLNIFNQHADRVKIANIAQMVKVLRAKKAPRQLFLKAQAQQEALQAMRSYISSEEGKALYARRAGVEGTISQGVRGFGLRQSRYRGL